MFVAFGLGFTLTLYFRSTILEWLLLPARGHLSPSGQPIYTQPTEMLSVTIQLVMVGGAVTAIPVLIVQTALFVSPVLRWQQRGLIFLFLMAVLACFLAGVAFSYWVLLPAGLRFLLSFDGDIVTPMIGIAAYMELTLSMLFWLGVVFELPLVMFLLTWLRVISHQRWRRLHKYVPWAAILFGGIITPSIDLVNLALVAVPLAVLYEVGLGLSWLASRSRRA